MTIWFTSDWHLFHKNIIKYCGRPFKNTHYMNKTILANYHERVKENDQVFFLGDLTMEGPSSMTKIKPLLESLPGTKHLVLGNHDRFKPFSYHEMGFSSVHTALQKTFYHDDLMFGQSEFFMAHDPAWAQIPETLWICGHVHEQWKAIKTAKDVSIVNMSVEVWDYSPVPLEEVVKTLMNARRVPA